MATESRTRNCEHELQVLEFHVNIGKSFWMVNFCATVTTKIVDSPCGFEKLDSNFLRLKLNWLSLQTSVVLAWPAVLPKGSRPLINLLAPRLKVQ